MKIVKNFLFVFIVISGLSFLLVSGGCKTSEEHDMDIVETAIANGNFTTLVTALQAADLVDTLKQPGPYTVFAPTDAAFAMLPAGTLDTLLANIPLLSDILLYHVAPGQYLAADVASLSSLAMANSQNATISGNVMIDNANIVQTDILCSNGVIHVIDAVIIPD
jgi:uncharacterized surface protein with fasciclin (FAS1) repeats